MNSLVISGTAVMIFGLWSIVKTVVYYLTSPNRAGQILQQEMDGVYAPLVIILAAAVVIDLLLRIFICLSARGEGRGKKKGSFYLVVTGLLAFFSAAYIALLVLYGSGNGLLDTVVSVILEISALAALIDVMVSAVNARRLGRLSGAMEG